MNFINNFFVYRILVPKPLRTLIWKSFLKKKILSFYSNTNDIEIKKIKRFLLNNKTEIFPYEFIFNYDFNKIKVNYDKLKKLNYVDFNTNKKLFFKKSWSRKRIQKAFNQLLIEQDNDSPHRYLTKNFNVDKDSVVADIGCAEANFSLEIIDKVKHIYLFESNSNWLKPLNATFEKYKNKITIINKKLSNFESEKTIDGKKFFKNKNINFLKIDVDGAEEEVLSGLSDFIKNSEQIKIAFCTYHKQNDFKLYSRFFKENGFKVENSKGYTVFYWDKNLKAPYLRRGLIRVKKSINS